MATTSPPISTEWFTPTEAADYLRVTIVTIYRWAAQGRITLYRLGPRTTRLRRSELDALAEPIKSQTSEYRDPDWLSECDRVRENMPLTPDSAPLFREIRSERAER